MLLHIFLISLKPGPIGLKIGLTGLKRDLTGLKLGLTDPKLGLIGLKLGLRSLSRAQKHQAEPQAQPQQPKSKPKRFSFSRIFSQAADFEFRGIWQCLNEVPKVTKQNTIPSNPLRGCCPAHIRITQKNQKQGKGTDDHILPLGIYISFKTIQTQALF